MVRTQHTETNPPTTIALFVSERRLSIQRMVDRLQIYKQIGVIHVFCMCIKVLKIHSHSFLNALIEKKK